MVIVLGLAMVIMEAVVAWGVWHTDPVPGSPAAAMGILVSRIVVALVGQVCVIGSVAVIWILAKGLQAQRYNQDVDRER